MPRKTLIALLVLLAAGLAAWFVLNVGPVPTPRAMLDEATLRGTEREEATLHGASLVANGSDTARTAEAPARAGWSLPVHVHGPNGEPLAGARVAVLAPRWNGDGLFGQLDTAAVSATNAEGRAFVTQLPSATLAVHVSADGLASSSIQVVLPSPDAPPSPVLVRLWPPRVLLRVAVRDPAGAAIAGAAIDITDASGRLLAKGTSSASGNADFALGSANEMRIEVRAPGYLRRFLASDMATLAEQAELELTLQPAQEVRGRLIATAPAKLPDALRLSARSRREDLRQPPWTWIEQEPDAEGRFLLWALPAEHSPTLRITVTSDSHGLLHVFEVDLTQPTTDLRLDLTPVLLQHRAVAIHVVHADGSPAAFADVESMVARTNGGRYRVRGVLDAEGSLDLPFPVEGAGLTYLTVIDARAVRQTLGLEEREGNTWRLNAYGTAHGHVTEADGSRPVSAVVGFHAMEAPLAQRFFGMYRGEFWRPCDANGEFTCHGLAPGIWYVVAGAGREDAPRGVDGAVRIEVKANATAEVGAIALPQRHVLRGRVRDAESKAVAGLALHATVQGAGGTVGAARGETDTEGLFTLELARLGRLDLYAADPRWGVPRSFELVEPLAPIEITLPATPILVVRFERRTPPDGDRATLCLSPVGDRQSHALDGTIVGGELRVRLPANLAADTEYEGWVECGDYLGDITPLPTDLSGPGPHVMSMWTRLPDDDDE